MDSLRKTSPPKRVEPIKTPTEYFPRRATPAQMPLPAFHSPKKSTRPPWSWKKIAFGLFLFIFCIGLAAALFFLFKGFVIGRSVQIQNSHPLSFFSDVKRLAASFLDSNTHSLRGEDSGRINILLLGRAGEHYPGKNLTDTVMVMSIDTANKQVALLSLPRDLYAPIPGTTSYTKINALYQYGLSQEVGTDLIRSSVADITGQPIDYTFILDFDGFEKAIDALGGIQVDVLRDFYDTRYPGKNYSYETFEIKKGWQTLDGATALKYVRERHNDPEGDFGRARRQQQVIETIKDKAFSLETFLNVFAINALLDTLGESVKTDMTLEDMESFIKLARTLDTENISSVVIDAWKKESLLRVSHVQVGPTAAFILVPRVGNWSEIHDVSENIFRLDALQVRRDRIAAEAPTLTLLAAPGDTLIANRMKRIIAEEMQFDTVTLAPQSLLENRPEQSIIVDRSGMEKPFSLDELLKKFALRKEATLPFESAVSDTTDFVIIIGEDLADALAFDEENAAALADDMSFSEPLPPQEKPKKKKH